MWLAVGIVPAEGSWDQLERTASSQLPLLSYGKALGHVGVPGAGSSAVCLSERF